MKPRVFKTLRKKTKKNILQIIICALILFVIITFFFKDNERNQTFGHEINDIIQNIRKISSEKDVLSISLDQPMSIYQFYNFSKHLFLFTQAFNQPLILNHESILNISLESESEFKIYFDFPFVMNYLCYLSIFSEIPRLERPLPKQFDVRNIRKKSIKTYELLFNITEFINSNKSHLQCFGNDSLTRWCDMRNIGYIKTRLLFYTYAYFKFPSPFLSIGCRAPPFDIVEDRLYDEPMVTIPDSSIKYNLNYPDITYIVGRFHNSMMMWHVLFDFMIPLYWTINKIESNFTSKSNRTILLRDSQYNVLLDFVEPFSMNPIRNIKDDTRNLFFKRAIVGLPKFEKKPERIRRISHMATFEYNFNDNISIGLRDVVLKGFEIEDKPVNHSNPTIVYVSRENSQRDIINSNEVLDLMKKSCSFCDVKSVIFHHLTPREQIRVVSHASVLVGLHGSGLTHSLWLPRSNSKFEYVLLEILPYKYWCRNWYHTAANIAGIKYFSTMNTGRILPEVNKNSKLIYKTCSLKKSSCNSILCNDILKDQKFQMELDTFNSTWIKIVDILKRNRKNAKEIILK